MISSFDPLLPWSKTENGREREEEREREREREREEEGEEFPHLGVGKLSSRSTQSGEAPIHISGPGMVIGLEVEEGAGKLLR